MTDKDEQLLAQFFEPARQQHISDNGFSNRVMEALPARPTEATAPTATATAAATRTTAIYTRLSHLWTACCLLLAGILFSVTDGWSLLQAALTPLVSTLLSPLGMVAILLTATTTALWMLTEILRRERNMLLY